MKIIVMFMLNFLIVDNILVFVDSNGFDIVVG